MRCKVCNKPFNPRTTKTGIHTTKYCCRRITTAMQKYGWTLQQAKAWYGHANWPP